MVGDAQKREVAGASDGPVGGAGGLGSLGGVLGDVPGYLGVLDRAVAVGAGGVSGGGSYGLF
jgi:hypothetical protein